MKYILHNHETKTIHVCFEAILKLSHVSKGGYWLTIHYTELIDTPVELTWL